MREIMLQRRRDWASPWSWYQIMISGFRSLHYSIYNRVCKFKQYSKKLVNTNYGQTAPHNQLLSKPSQAITHILKTLRILILVKTLLRCEYSSIITKTHCSIRPAGLFNGAVHHSWVEPYHAGIISFSHSFKDFSKELNTSSSKPGMLRLLAAGARFSASGCAMASLARMTYP